MAPNPLFPYDSAVSWSYPLSSPWIEGGIFFQSEASNLASGTHPKFSSGERCKHHPRAIVIFSPNFPPPQLNSHDSLSPIATTIPRRRASFESKTAWLSQASPAPSHVHSHV